MTRRISRRAALVVAIVIETADGPGGVECGVVEGQVFSLGPGEPAGHLGMTLAAELELSAGDVHAVDGPVFGKETEVLSGADAYFQPTGARQAQSVEVLQDLHAGAADTALEDQERLLPGTKLYPAGAVIECRHDAISLGERADCLEDAAARLVISRTTRAAWLSTEPSGAGDAARELGDRRSRSGRSQWKDSHRTRSAVFRSRRTVPWGPQGASSNRRTSRACT